MDAFLRLLRYARAHRGLIAGAVLAMVVYGAASAALAWLIKPIVDDVLQSQDRLGFVVTALLVAYFFKGLGAYFSSYLMDDIGQRVVRRDPWRSLPSPAEPVGGVLRHAHHRAAALAHQQRRRAGAAGRRRDGR